MPNPQQLDLVFDPRPLIEIKLLSNVVPLLIAYRHRGPIDKPTAPHPRLPIFAQFTD
jgi:hypothetical protein